MSRASGQRFFEDLAIGETIELRRMTVTKDMVVGFAREFDPFPFHLDEAAAKKSLLGGLAASGWQTVALSQRMLVDGFLSGIASLGSQGFTDLKWKKPVMVGDSIGGTATLVDLQGSEPDRDRGVVTIALDVRNGRGEPVMSMHLTHRVATRTETPDLPAEPASTTSGDGDKR